MKTTGLKWMMVLLGILVNVTVAAETVDVITDDFSDNDYTANPQWVVDAGVFAADGTDIGNVNPTAGMLNFGDDQPTAEIHTDWDRLEPNTPMMVTASFDLFQPNGAETTFFQFTFGFKDSLTEQIYYEQASLSVNAYGGPPNNSGFHSWDGNDNMTVGLDPNASLTNGWQRLTMTFDSQTGVKVYHEDLLVAQWNNYKNIEQVDAFFMKATQSSGIMPSWFVDNVAIEIVQPYVIADSFTNGGYDRWTVESGTFDASNQYLQFGTGGGTSIHLDLPVIEENSVIDLDFQLQQTNGTNGYYQFIFGLKDTANGVSHLEKASCNAGSYGTSGFHGFNSGGAYVVGEPGMAIGPTTAWQNLHMTFHPAKGITVTKDDALAAKWLNWNSMAAADQVYFNNDNGVVTWRVDNVSVDAYKPTIIDLFTDEDYTSNPAWTVVSGNVASDGSDLGNAHPEYGVKALAFDTASSTKVYLDLGNVADNTPVEVYFELWQGNGAAGCSYNFNFSLEDSLSGESYTEFATLNPAYYGPSGFNSYDAAGNLIAGTAGESLGNSRAYITMTFDPDDGVEIYNGDTLVAAWPNFKNLDRVDRLVLDPGGIVSWFVDSVAVEAVVYDPQFCGDEGTRYMTGDVTEDCQVDMADLSTMGSQWLQNTDPANPDAVNLTGNDYLILPGTATVDGDLSDWADAQWFDLDQQYFGFGMDVSSAQFAVRWDQATDSIYAAVKVNDSYNVFEDSPTAWDTCDRVEIYTQGSAAGGTGYEANDFDTAQQYVVGPTLADPDVAWVQLGAGTSAAAVPAQFQYAVQVDAGMIYYEFAVPQFDTYDGTGGGTSVPSAIAAGDTVGFDVIVDTRYLGFDGMTEEFGMWSENLMGSKFTDANNFQQYTLVAGSCGDWGYAASDISGAAMTPDCAVDLHDLAVIAADWMACTDPQDPSCDVFWK